MNHLLSSSLIATLCLSLLTGCAETRIRQQAQTALQAGQYEQAVQTLDTGLKSYPDSPTLRAGLVQARTEGLTRLLTEATAARATGRLDDATTLLERAKPFDPGLKRVTPLLAEIDTERRQRLALKDARQLVEQRKPTAALLVLTDALKDNPRHPDLLALQRKLEIDARQAQVRAAQTGLSEARPISLDFRDANLRTVLDVVSRNSGINFILDKDIRQDTRVTVFLKSAKVEEAIDLIVNTYQLAKKVIDGQTILIYPNTPDKQREHQEQVVRVFYLANADAKNTAAFLKAMLKLREPFVDERTNLLALRDTPENVLLAERLIALFDAAEPEVLLELEVLEVSSTRLTELGVRFPDSFSLTPLAPLGANGLNLLNIEGITRDRVGVSVGGLLVNLKRAIGDVNTLSAPRIRVKSKEKAKILIGDKIPLITATTGPNGFVADSVSYIDVGLKLDVEPTVYTDDEVAIKIALEVSSLGTQIKTASGTLAYQIGTRNASTLLRLRDGQTQLLAGIISRSERTSANRVPGLGDVPMVGRLFSSQADSADRTELVLAITPHVLRNLRQPDAATGELWVGTGMCCATCGSRTPPRASCGSARMRRRVCGRWAGGCRWPMTRQARRRGPPQIRHHPPCHCRRCCRCRPGDETHVAHVPHVPGLHTDRIARRAGGDRRARADGPAAGRDEPPARTGARTPAGALGDPRRHRCLQTRQRHRSRAA
nr:secretin N-terminal domain-containing protein [Sphaerotilus sp.]